MQINASHLTGVEAEPSCVHSDTNLLMQLVTHPTSQVRL